MEASGRMLEVLLLLGQWLHSRQSVPLPYDPDRLPELIKRMKEEKKLSKTILTEAAELTEQEIGNLISDLDQLKIYLESAQETIFFKADVEEVRG